MSSRRQSHTTGGKVNGVAEGEEVGVEGKGEGGPRSCLTVTSSCPAGRLSCCTSQRRDRPSVWEPAAWSSLPPPQPTTSLTATTLLAPRPPPHHSEGGTGPHPWTAVARLNAAYHSFHQRVRYQRTAAHRDSPHHHLPPSGKAVMPHSECTHSTAQACQKRPVLRYRYVFTCWNKSPLNCCFICDVLAKAERYLLLLCLSFVWLREHQRRRWCSWWCRRWTLCLGACSVAAEALVNRSSVYTTVLNSWSTLASCWLWTIEKSGFRMISVPWSSKTPGWGANCAFALRSIHH